LIFLQSGSFLLDLPVLRSLKSQKTPKSGKELENAREELSIEYVRWQI
jgi:hypothetical protein